MERIDDVEYDFPEYHYDCCECDECDCCDDCEDCDGEDEEDDDPPEYYHGTFFGSFGKK